MIQNYGNGYLEWTPAKMITVLWLDNSTSELVPELVELKIHEQETGVVSWTMQQTELQHFLLESGGNVVHLYTAHEEIKSCFTVAEKNKCLILSTNHLTEGLKWNK